MKDIYLETGGFEPPLAVFSLVAFIVVLVLFAYGCLLLANPGSSEGSEGQSQSKDKGHAMLAEISRHKLAEKRLKEIGKLEEKGIILRETEEGVVAVKNGREYGPFDDIHMPKRIGEMTGWDIERLGMRVEMLDYNYPERYVKWLSCGQPPEVADELARKGLDPKKPGGFRAGIGILK